MKKTLEQYKAFIAIVTGIVGLIVLGFSFINSYIYYPAQKGISLEQKVDTHMKQYDKDRTETLERYSEDQKRIEGKLDKIWERMINGK